MVMAKFTVDTANKLFIAKAGVITFDVKVDLYSDAKEHWISDNTANKFTFPFISPTTGRTTVQGGPDINPAKGTSIPTYAFLENGWRIRPDEADHTLSVTGGVLLVQGGGDPFVDTLGAFTVRVLYEQPVQAIVVTSGSGLSAVQAAQLLEIFKRLSLDSTDAFTTTPAQMRTASGDIVIDITGDGETSSTGERQ